MQQNPLKSFPFILLVLGTLFSFGFSWPIMKLALQHIPPLWLAATRLGLATIILFIVLIICHKKLLPTRQDIPILLSVGILQMSVFMVLMHLGLQHVQAGRSAVLVYTTPLWVTPLAVLIFKEPLHKLTLLGLILGLIGLACLFNPLTFDWHNKAALNGNILLLLAAFAWACVILHLRFGKKYSSALELAPWQLLIATLFLWITGCILEPAPQITWSGSFILEISYISIIATAFAFVGAIEMSRQLPAVTSSLVFLGVPVIGLISSALILGETITLNTLIAVLLILTGLVCVALTKRPAIVPVE